MSLAEWERILQQHGFAAYGVCDFDTVRAHLLPCGAARRLPPNARRVLTVLFPYRFPEDGPRNLSRYACVEDYHTVGGNWMRRTAADLAAAMPPYVFEPFMDNSPLPEVQTAAHCGLGVIGDHGLLIHPRYGSWVFIGCFVTDAPLPLSETPAAHCSHCGACGRACPGGCLPGGDRAGCLSAISQKKGELTPVEAASLRRGGLVWGCDRCQEVCPLGRAAVSEPHPCFTVYRPFLTDADLEDLAGKAYGWRGAAVPRRNLRLLQDPPEPTE